MAVLGFFFWVGQSEIKVGHKNNKNSFYRCYIHYHQLFLSTLHPAGISIQFFSMGQHRVLRTLENAGNVPKSKFRVVSNSSSAKLNKIPRIALVLQLRQGIGGPTPEFHLGMP
jgi:hypothetical protein